MRFWHLLFCLLVSISITAQKKKSTPPSTAPKKALDHTVYDSWKEITYTDISPDGKFAAFTINPQDGDGKVVFHNISNGKQESVARADNIDLSWDSQFAVFKIKPQQTLVKDLRRQKKKKDEMPTDTLGIFSLTSGKLEKIPNVKSFKIPEKAGGWVAYLSDPGKDVKAADDKTKKARKAKKNSDDNGFTFTIRSLNGAKTFQYGYVKEFVIAKYGQGVLFTSTGNDSTMKAGMYWHNLSSGAVTNIHEGRSKYKYKGLAVSENGTRAAFLLDTDTTKALIRHFKLLHWKSTDAKAVQQDVEHSLSLPAGWIVSEHYTPEYSKNGNKLYFGTSPEPVVQDTTLLPEEIIQVEIWGNNDEYIYPEQNKRLSNERKRSYLAVVDLESNQVSTIGTVNIPDVDMGDEGNADIALATTNKPYRRLVSWDRSAFNDFYIYNMKNKTMQQIAERVKGNARLSPKAKFAFWFNEPDTSWYAHKIGSDTVLEIITSKHKIWVDEENDSPDYANPYGFAGWTTNDEKLLAYDRYDIWSLDPGNKAEPVNLTRVGREQRIVFRYISLDREQRNIDPAQDILLSAFNEVTKANGYYKLNINTGVLTKLLMEDARIRGTIKAKQSNQILFTRETFREFPDLWTATTSLTGVKKISDANPQMKNYYWGTAELVHWKSADGVPLDGILYKSEGFDPKKKYPMIVYFYEKESDNLHLHVTPNPIRSHINRTTYVSDGYIVFIPDIVYKIGYPGQSAYNCILPGVEYLIKQGFVDEKNVGIQGHSWGGYQTAYIVTRTGLFKAAEAGAIVANMTSAYGGIRWESGFSRMFQYEHTQSRIGATLWDKPQLYLENSPLFSADKITTPVLLLHNDADGAVPWYQGIEMYMAMRRLDKKVWMLNYNGEPHWPFKRENRMDFQIRMKQFFDYYLKGAPMPPWMKDGIPAIEKGIIKGY